MTLLATLPPAIRSRLFPAQRGWLGIDFGSQCIKLAQIERSNGSYRLAAKWLLGYPNDTVPTRASTQASAWKETIASFRGLARMFQGRKCAVTLPMSLVDARSFEIPRGHALETRGMVREELAADLGQEPEELACDFGEMASDNGDPALMRVLALAIPQSFALELGKDLLRTRLECQAIDGIPCALARAVALLAPNDDEPVAAIDLGYTSSSLVVVQSGEPRFFRSLRGVGLQSLTAPLRKELQLSAEECRQLLLRFGIPARGQPVTAAAQATQQHLAHGLDTLTSEIQRTLSYVGQQYRRLAPKRLWLFGGGATIRHLPSFLEDKLQLPVAPWRLSPAEDASPAAQDALFGVAAALSLLAWEKQSCT
jgi:type IV pilus assembly protein PilM